MPAKLLGPIDWVLRKDDESVRDYFIKWRIQTSSTKEGPVCVEQCPGLPLPQSIWAFPFMSPSERYENAFCTPEMNISRQLSGEGEPSNLWIVDQTFSNRRTEGEKLE